ncbi:MAG: AI-2E family transporter [Actinomycetota bacterium]
MSEPQPRKVPYNVILASIWLTVGSAAALALVYFWRALIFHLVVAAFLALVLNPAVRRLEKWGMHRGAAILLVVIIFFFLFAGLIAAVAAPVSSQGVNFAKHAPQYLQQAEQHKGPLSALARKFHLDKELTKAAPAISKTLSKLPSRILGVLRTAASTAVSVATVLILAIFMLVEGPTFVSAFVAGIPDSKREQVRLVGSTTSSVVSRYTLGVVGLGFLNGLITAVVLKATGVPFVTSLAVWAGLVDVLPIVGGLVAIVSAGLFAFAHSLVAGIVVVAVMFAYQQVKNHALYPLAVGRAVQLNALLVLVAVLAGSELMGITGALLAIPIAGTLHAVIVEFAPPNVQAFLRHPDPHAPAPTGTPRGAGAEAVEEAAVEGEEATTKKGRRRR